MNREQAHQALRTLVISVDERDESAAVERLLERIANRDDAEVLRAALVGLGARSALRILRGSR